MNRFRTPINAVLGSLFLGSFALLVAVFLWNAAEMDNPVATVIAPHLPPEAYE